MSNIIQNTYLRIVHKFPSDLFRLLYDCVLHHFTFSTCEVLVFGSLCKFALCIFILFVIFWLLKERRSLYGFIHSSVFVLILRHHSLAKFISKYISPLNKQTNKKCLENWSKLCCTWVSKNKRTFISWVSWYYCALPWLQNVEYWLNIDINILIDAGL